MDKIRLFYALNLTDEVKNVIGNFIDEHKKSIDFVRWIKPDNIHLTLRFLGDTDTDKLDFLKKVADSLVLDFKKKEFSIEGVGCFPNLRRPRVIWFGITDGSDYIRSLNKSLNRRLSDVGMSEDVRFFKPHITVGRTKSIFLSDCFKNVLINNKNRHFADSELESLSLYKSILTRQGSVYKELHRSFFL